jgi:ribosome biogenesis GTPase
VAPLLPWLTPGQTIALLGSSGVGKSTLVNTLSDTERQATAAIRESDGRGRHTTTRRSLHRLTSGAWLLDTPGMRELQLVDAAEGLNLVFDDVASVARRCRFGDCTHESEPGCAIKEALQSGRLDPGRMERYRKLVREERRNAESAAEARARERAFGRMAKGVMADKARRRGRR